MQPYAGLLSFFLPPKETKQATGLVTEILRIASQTDSGAAASQQNCEEIARLVSYKSLPNCPDITICCLGINWLNLFQAEQLQQAGGVKDPVYSSLAWGDYEVMVVMHISTLNVTYFPKVNQACIFSVKVTYSSKPQAAGGPILRSPPGKLVFANQQLRQTLSPPESLVNSVSFSGLGVFPGNAIQPAIIQPLTGTKYKVSKGGSLSIGISHDFVRLCSVCTVLADHLAAGQIIWSEAWAREHRAYI